MAREMGTPNKGRLLRQQPIKHGRRVWHYDGTLTPDALHITKIHGDITGRAVELDEAIKAECRRLGVTTHLDDRVAADELYKAMIPKVLP